MRLATSLRAPALGTVLLVAWVSGVCSEALATLPTSFDWRNVDGVDYVSGVRNSGNCGSSFIFAPVAMVESRQMIAAGRLGHPVIELDYSEQYLLSCGTSPTLGDFSCGGGNPTDVLNYMRNVGVPFEACYVYRGADETCPASCPDTGQLLQLIKPVVTTAYRWSYPGDAVMMQEIYDNGPVAVLMDVYTDFYNYLFGVYTHQVGSYMGGTAVLIVGWGEESATGYWIVKNCWDTWWGDHGYFKIARASQGNCNFATWSYTCTVSAPPVSVEPAGSPLGLLGPIRPNPFGRSTVIRYCVSTDATVSLRIHDTAGRRVTTLVEGTRPAGNYDVTWDGRDQGGRRVARGVYYCRLEAGGRVETGRMVLAY
jgi:hypothetical protein